MIFEMNGTETLDGCLYRNQMGTSNTETVMLLNPHLATLAIHPPFGTQVVVPEVAPSKTIKTINLWD